MPYEGKQLMQREVTDLAAAHWPNRKVEATATFIGESHQFVGAWHDNIRDGIVLSRDCGLAQNNIPGSQVGTKVEWELRSKSLDAAEYLPVAKHNISVAFEKYDSPWTGGRKREWQPWVAYTSGWALWPHFFAWHRERGTLDSKPLGPWVPTGRYLHQAIRAVANWHLLIAKTLSVKKALAEAERLADLYGITDGALAHDKRRGVYWLYPLPPKDPPEDPDAITAYPHPNDGRSFLTVRAAKASLPQT